jgi:hypothetical protein
MKKFKKLMKCSTCGNVGEFEYVGSRNCLLYTSDAADIAYV